MGFKTIKLNKFKILLITILLLISITLLLNFKINKVKALANSDSSIDITIDENLNSNFKLNISYINVTDTKVFESVRVVFPFKDIENLKVDNTFGEFNFNKEVEGNTTSLLISLKDKLSIFNLDPILNIEFDTKSLVKEFFSLKQFYFPYYENDFSLQSFKFNITYPVSFGNNLTVYSNDYNSIGNSISGSSNGALKILWGEIDNVYSNFKIGVNNDLNISENTEEDILENEIGIINLNSYLLFNLPFERDFTFEYLNSPTLSYAFNDKYLNNYVLIPKSDTEFNFEMNIYSNGANILESESNLNNTNNVKYFNSRIEKESFNVFNNEFNIDKSKNFYLEALEFVEVVNTPLEKLRAVNEYLKNKLSPNLNEVISNESVNLIWEKLSESDKFNSFEYCYIIGSFAKEFNIPFRIVYGYLLNETSTPHVWCEFKLDNTEYILDPLLEEVNLLTYFMKDSRDRITYGMWSLDSNSGFLGLRSDISSPIISKFRKNDVNTLSDINEVSEVNESSNNLKTLSLSIDSNISLQSGVSNYLGLRIYNPNNFFFYPKDILISNNSYNVEEVINDTNLIIPPLSEVEVNGEINPGIFLIDTNNTNLNYVIKSENFESNGLINLNIYVNKDLYKVILILVILILLITLLIKYKKSVTKRINFRLLKNLKSKYTFKTKIFKNYRKKHG